MVFELTTSCLRVGGASRAPQRQKQQREHLKGSQFMLQWFVTFCRVAQNASSLRKSGDRILGMCEKPVCELIRLLYVSLITASGN